MINKNHSNNLLAKIGIKLLNCKIKIACNGYLSLVPIKSRQEEFEDTKGVIRIRKSKDR